MEKRILVAAILSAMFMSWYAQAVLRTPGQSVSRPASQPPPGVEAVAQPALRLTIPQGLQEETVVLESPRIQLEIGKTSAAIRSVLLKDFLDESRRYPLQIRAPHPLLSVLVGDVPLKWKMTNLTSTAVSFEAEGNGANSYYISYEITSGNSNVDILLRHDGTTEKSELVPVSLLSVWTKGDKLDDRQNSLELFSAQVGVERKLKYSHFRGPIKQDKNVPRGTSILSLAERYFCQAVRIPDGNGSVTLLPSLPDTVAAQFRFQTNHTDAQRATVYFGPRDYFYLKAAGFEHAFPMGMLGQIGLILLSLLNGIANVVHNYGVALILFSALVTCAISPFTMISFRSMKKMQELKPQMDRIMAKHKDKPQEANREVFALYRQHRVSPLSGCLPMLLQLPIFFALFQAISHYVELRGKGFLWIRDLSLPDRIVKLPFSIPFLGSDVNLLPILMAFAMFVQQRMSQQSMPVGSTNPSMKLMSGPLMSVLFGVMFYQFPSGLVLYWLTNSLISLAWYRVAK